MCHLSMWEAHVVLACASHMSILNIICIKFSTNWFLGNFCPKRNDNDAMYNINIIILGKVHISLLNYHSIVNVPPQTTNCVNVPLSNYQKMSTPKTDKKTKMSLNFF
jgi:hypothetical protein